MSLRIIEKERVQKSRRILIYLTHTLLKLESNRCLTASTYRVMLTLIDGSDSASPTEIAVFLSSFDAVKGFEFETEIVADASAARMQQ